MLANRTVYSSMQVVRWLSIILAILPGALWAQEGGHRYALLVGVETYDPAVLRRLDYAEDDVVAVGQALERLGFTVIVMTHESDIPARRPSTSQKILAQFDGVLKRAQSDQDTLFVMLAGHGLQYKDDLVNAEGAKESYFCPEEANPKDRGSLVSISDLSRRVGACRAARKLLVIDAFRNEVLAKGNRALEEELDPVGGQGADGAQGDVGDVQLRSEREKLGAPGAQARCIFQLPVEVSERRSRSAALSPQTTQRSAVGRVHVPEHQRLRVPAAEPGPDAGVAGQGNRLEPGEAR